MKIRTGFVSNSSSTSFVLHKEFMTDEQITNVIDYLENINEDGWTWRQSSGAISGSTAMDNDYFTKKLKELNVGLKAVDWNHSG